MTPRTAGQMRAAKARGSKWEQDVCDYLAANGFPHAERRHLRGNQDRGDIAGIPGWTLEAKAVKTITLGGFVDEAKLEAVHAGTDLYAAVIRRRGYTDPARGFLVTDLEAFARWAAL
jgi:hypothetical protein